MALINCPECGRQVSDKAVACPDCGYPVASAKATEGTVAIRINKNVSPVLSAISTVQVLTHEGKVLGEGKVGSVIRFRTKKALSIGLGFKQAFSLMLTATVKPNCRYELIKEPTVLFSKYRLNEIDVIDSGL